MNLRKVGHIMRREYVESVRKKSFVFGLVATPIILITLVYLPLFAGEMVSDERAELVVLDHTHAYGARVRTLLAEDDSEGLDIRVDVRSPESGPPRDSLDAAVIEGALTGWLLLPSDFAETGEFEYHAESLTNLAILQKLESVLGLVLTEEKAARYGMTSEEIEVLLRPVEMKTFHIGKEGGEETDFSRIYLRAVAMVMILFFALMPTGQILMRSVIEEKANRVIEVLLSSVSPMELMVGKILGLGAVGLTLIGTWASVGSFLALRGGGLPITANEAWIFALYFFPGYFFYAAVLGSIGSVCTSEREAQPFLTPISLMLVFPVMLGFAIAQSPDHIVARILSFIPFFTPTLMMFRYAIKEPPAWEIAATWLSLVVGTGFMFWIASRIFRIGVLMYGKRPTLPEIGRWIWSK